MTSGPGPAPLVLLVEDDRAVADPLLYALRTEGFATRWATTGAAARADLAHGPAAVLLDLGLPDVLGFDLLRDLRRLAPALPILVLTARAELPDRVAGLELGADDYIPKPFSPREVTARLRAVLRRARPTPAPPAAPAAGETWHHDPDGCRILFHGVALDLTRYEYRLLATLLARPGRVLSRDQLMEVAWEDPGASLDRTVDAHVKTLRAKLRAIDPAGDPIRTHRGLGYSLRPPGPAAACPP